MDPRHGMALLPPEYQINIPTPAAKKIEIPAGGNLVLSYLDIVAPGETPTSELLAAIPAFLENVRHREMPWTETIGRCTFRFAVEPSLASTWAKEFEQLLRSALYVRAPL